MIKIPTAAPASSGAVGAIGLTADTSGGDVSLNCPPPAYNYSASALWFVVGGVTVWAGSKIADDLLKKKRK